MKCSLLIILLCFHLVISCTNEELKTLDIEIINRYKKVNIHIKDYCIQNEKDFVDVYASNYSAILKKDRLLIDTDRDGLPNKIDSVENYAISPMRYDTNADGYRDLLVYNAGIDIENQQYLKKCELFDQDTDGDGVTDCEENNFLRSDPENFDTDGDGIPDELEIMNHLNLNDPNDSYQDFDADGLINSEEVRLHTPINVSNDKNIKGLEYKYEITLSDNKIGENVRCFDMYVRNISLVDVNNGNLIRFAVIEKMFNERVMRTFRIIIEYDKVDDDELLEYDFELLVEGV